MTKLLLCDKCSTVKNADRPENWLSTGEHNFCPTCKPMILEVLTSHLDSCKADRNTAVAWYNPFE